MPGEDEEFELPPDDDEESIEPLEYQDLVTTEPERKSDDGDGLDEISDGVFEGSLSNEENSGGKLSDLQTIVKQLTPQYDDDELNQLARSARVARTYPDNVLDKNFLLVMSRYEKHSDDTDYNFMMDVSLIQDFVSIGIEGRGIADLLELAGVAHEEEMQKLGESLGF